MGKRRGQLPRLKALACSPPTWWWWWWWWWLPGRPHPTYTGKPGSAQGQGTCTIRKNVLSTCRAAAAARMRRSRSSTHAHARTNTLL